MNRFTTKLFAIATLATLSLASAARADVAFEVRVLAVKGPGVTINNPHSVSVSATGGTISFGVYAVVTNGKKPDPNDAFQTARGYILAGLPGQLGNAPGDPPISAGNVPGNNGPIGNLTSGIMVTPFNANGSVGPPGSGASQGTTATVDLNGDTFTDYGNLTMDSKLDLIPRSGSMTTNAANANASSFLFFTFSMPVTSQGADPVAGSTNVSFICNGEGIAVGYQQAGIPKMAHDGIGASIPTVIYNGKPPAKPPATTRAATRPAPTTTRAATRPATTTSRPK